MGDAARKLLDQALALPEDDREVLAIQLMQSLGPRDEGWEEAWSAEIERRLADVDAGRVELRSWEEVRAELHARLAAGRAR